jgi:hypothetical protein
MGSEAKADRVRLTVPADAAMVDVVRAATRSLCARVGLPDAAVESTRNAVSDLFFELAGAGDADVVLVAWVRDDDLEIGLSAGGQTRKVAVTRDREP